MQLWPKSKWDAFAVNYDDIAKKQHWIAPYVLAYLAKNYLDTSHPVLEIGSGTGIAGRLLADTCEIVDGIDFSIEMLKQAKSVGYRHLIAANARVPVPLCETYGTIFSVGMFGDVVSYRHVKHVLPLLNKNGTIAIAGEQLQPLSLLLKKQGFSIMEEIESIAYIKFMENMDHVVINYNYIVAVR